MRRLAPLVSIPLLLVGPTACGGDESLRGSDSDSTAESTEADGVGGDSSTSGGTLTIEQLDCLTGAFGTPSDQTQSFFGGEENDRRDIASVNVFQTDDAIVVNVIDHATADGAFITYEAEAAGDLTDVALTQFDRTVLVVQDLAPDQEPTASEADQLAMECFT